MTRLIPLLLLTACAGYPIKDWGVRDTDNEPWPILSENRCTGFSCFIKGGKYAWIERHCIRPVTRTDVQTHQDRTADPYDVNVRFVVV